MLSSAISALGDRLDAKFMTAYWLPAFVFVLGGIGILSSRVGWRYLDEWVQTLDAVEQSLGSLVIILMITMLAFVLRALTRPIAEFYAGIALPRVVADWSTRGQLRVKARARQLLDADAREPESPSTGEEWLDRRFPVDDADIRPTLFGNVLASAGEHPRFAYAMEGSLWWPRLSPLLPGYFQDSLAGAQAPLMALLNLSVVFVGLALEALIVLGLFGMQWMAAIATMAGVLVLSWLCYRAAVSQATDIATSFRVAFDLYRYSILDQLGREHPADAAAEQALWQHLTQEMLGKPVPTPIPAAKEGAPPHPDVAR